MAVVVSSLELDTPSTLRVVLSDGTKSIETVVAFPPALQKQIMKICVEDTRLFMSKVEVQLQS